MLLDVDNKDKCKDIRDEFWIDFSELFRILDLGDLRI